MTCEDCEYLINENSNLKQHNKELENKLLEIQSRMEQIRLYVI